MSNQFSIQIDIESFNNWKPVLFSSSLLPLHRHRSSWATPAILGLITPEAEYHGEHQVIRTSSYFIISWLPIMPSIHLDAKCWPIPSVTFESHIKIISLCDALPFKESVITLLLAMSSSMISYFCSIMANYQAIYLFLLFQMLHYGPAIPVVFQVLWRLTIPCFSPSFKGHFISGQAPSLPSGL